MILPHEHFSPVTGTNQKWLIKSGVDSVGADKQIQFQELRMAMVQTFVWMIHLCSALWMPHTELLDDFDKRSTEEKAKRKKRAFLRTMPTDTEVFLRSL